MAFNAATWWECQTGGSDTSNSGGFDTSTSNKATDLAATSATGTAPVVTSASYNFVAGDVGHWVFVVAGTNWTPGFFKIASVASNAATLDAAIGHAVLATGTPNTVAGCATTASPASGTWSVDYSQTSTPRITFSDMVIDGTTNTKFTSVGNPVGKNFVGNTIAVTGGSGFTVQRVQIVSTSGTTATCDKSLGTLSSTGGAGGLGGALGSPGQAGGVAIGGNRVWKQSGVYTITSASTNVAGGCVSTPGAGDIWEGYGTVRGDKQMGAILRANGVITTFTLFNLGPSGTTARYFECDGNSRTSSRGFNLVNNTLGYRLIGRNCTNSAFITAGGTAARILFCMAVGCSTVAAIISDTALMCVSHDNTIQGFQGATQPAWNNNISFNNSGASSDGFVLAADTSTVRSCTSYNNGRDGFRFGNTGRPCLIENCVGAINAGYNYGASNAGSVLFVNNSAGYNTGTANANTTNITAATTGFVTLTGNPFDTSLISALTSTSTIDAVFAAFLPNSTSGAGALVRGAGVPVYDDIGAVQHQDSGGGAAAAMASMSGGFTGG